MAMLETTYLPQARVRQIPYLETEVSSLRKVYTFPTGPVMVRNTPIPRANITDYLYKDDFPHNRIMDADMVMVAPSLRVAPLFPLRLDKDRLGEIYNELTRENALFFSRNGIFLTDGKDRDVQNLRLENATFSLFKDELGVMRHQAQGEKPHYFYDELKKTAVYSRPLKKVTYKGEERDVFLDIEFDTEFFKDTDLQKLILNGAYDPKTLRRFLSYTFLIS